VDLDRYEAASRLLPEDFYLLARRPSGRPRIDPDVLAAGLAAAVLAELRLRGRARLADTEEATVVAEDPDPTGDPLLDGVLARVAGNEPLPAYRWVQLLGPEVVDPVAGRLDAKARDAGAVARQARTGIVRALNTGDLDSHEIALGGLLWGAELTAPVLGWTSLATRFWLGRVAKRDPLAVAIRIVVGLHMPAHGGGGTYGGG
jgi:hypothetical protein